MAETPVLGIDSKRRVCSFSCIHQGRTTVPLSYIRRKAYEILTGRMKHGSQVSGWTLASEASCLSEGWLLIHGYVWEHEDRRGLGSGCEWG